MKKKQLTNKLKERLPSDKTSVTTEELMETVLQTYADIRIEELRERLKRYEGSQYKTFGKIEELEEMQDL